MSIVAVFHYNWVILIYPSSKKEYSAIAAGECNRFLEPVRLVGPAGAIFGCLLCT
jgi:hypothetical protein